MPLYARIAIPILLVLLLGRLVWQGTHWLNHASRGASTTSVTVSFAPPASPAFPPPWQRDFFSSLDESIGHIKAGNITASEVAIDRAESILTAARLQSADARPEFFTHALASLDSVIEASSRDEHVFDHATEARISLAELRSSLNLPSAAAPTGVTRIAAPRPIAANETLDPRSLGGNYLDATLMPDTAEILLPPTTRAFDDGVRVENLTIAGASQTLDGIRWRNITFVGTRLRYEGGSLDLANVRFVRCRFGFFDDARGARLATALALAQSSITME